MYLKCLIILIACLLLASNAQAIPTCPDDLEACADAAPDPGPIKPAPPLGSFSPAPPVHYVFGVKETIPKIINHFYHSQSEVDAVLNDAYRSRANWVASGVLIDRLCAQAPYLVGCEYYK